MKYVLGFLRFWRHFIVGDDGLIAVAVMWALLFTWTLAKNYSNIWIIVPLCVILLMITVLYRRVANGAVSDVVPTRKSLLQLAVIPFTIVLIVPFVAFRIATGRADLESILLPSALFCLTALALWLLAIRTFNRFPVMTIFFFGGIAYFITLAWQPYYIRVSSELYRLTDPFVSLFVALVIIVFFISVSIKTWRAGAK